MKVSFENSQKISNFSRGLTHDFDQKTKILSESPFHSKEFDMMLDNVLSTKKGSLDNKKVVLT